MATFPQLGKGRAPVGVNVQGRCRHVAAPDDRSVVRNAWPMFQGGLELSDMVMVNKEGGNPKPEIINNPGTWIVSQRMNESLSAFLGGSSFFEEE